MSRFITRTSLHCNTRAKSRKGQIASPCFRCSARAWRDCRFAPVVLIRRSGVGFRQARRATDQERASQVAPPGDEQTDHVETQEVAHRESRSARGFDRSAEAARNEVAAESADR